MAPGPAQLQAAGAQPSQASLGAPLYHNRFKMGLWTQRNPLRDPSGVVTERWYGGGTDALLDGVNVEVTNRLTLARAPGSSSYSNQTFPQAPASFYSFKQFSGSTETINLIVDTPGVVYALNPTSKSTILTKAAGAGPSYFLGVGNVLYIGDGKEAKGWTALGTVRDWGLPQGAFGGGTSSNPTAYCTSAADPGGPIAWSNPSNAQGAPDGNFATMAIPTSTTTGDALVCTGYGFAATLPVNGIKVTIHAKDSSLKKTSYDVTPVLGGVPIGNTQTVLVNGSTVLDYILGGSGDLWGVAWTDAQVNDPTFGFQIVPTSAGSFSSNPAIDSVQIQLFTATSSPVSLVAGGFSPAPSVGYKYAVAYGDSSSGSVGPASALSALIKPDGTHSVQIQLLASSNARVNQIWVFRNRDGGSVWENLPASPYANSTTGVTDSSPDTALNLLQLADLQPADGGQALNTAPPAAAIAPEEHLGKVWVAVGNTVYYSSGSDLGLIVGNGNEGFPPANFFTFPSLVTRLLSVSTVDSAFLLVFTVSDVYAIYGNASAIAVSTGVSGLTQFHAASFLKRVGLPSWWALDVRGTQIYMFTSDKRLIRFNPSSQVVFLDPEKAIEEIGFPIGAPPPGVNLTGGTLDSFTPSSTFVSWHGYGSGDQALYVADGATGWFRGNINQQPDGGICWSTKRNITGGAGPVQSIETSPGVFQLLIGTSNAVLYRNTTSFSDAGSAYPSFGRFGGYVLAQPGQEAYIQFATADFVNTGSEPVIGVLLGELDGTFVSLSKTGNDPPHLAAPTTVKANRYALRQSGSTAQAPNACRYMQLKVDFGSSDTVQNEILSLTVFGSYEQEH